jgi:hypothetical protein
VSDDREPTRVLIGVFGEGMPTHLFIPRDGLKPAERILDREREKRETAAAKAKLATLQAAKAQGRLRRAIAACFHRGRKGR